MRWITPLFVLLFVLTGCSVLGLDDFDRCDTFGETVEEQEAACASALNREFGFAESCRPFRCVAGRCDLQRDVELCDSADNDCDGIVDENVFAPSGFVGVGFEQPPTQLSAAGGTESRAFWVDESNSGSTATILGTGTETRRALRYVRHADTDGNGADDDSVSTAITEDGCWRRLLADDTSTVRTDDDCDFLAVDAQGANARTVVTAVSSRGCAQGRLRVGELEGEDAVRVVGPLSRSNAYLGVGLTEDGACSAAVPSACDAARVAADGVAESGMNCTDSCPGDEVCVCSRQGGKCRSPERAAVERLCGFTSISSAAQQPSSGDAEVLVHAMVGAVGGSVQAACELPDIDGTPADESLRSVVAIGAFIEERVGIAFVNAADEATPLVLGETRGFGAPAVLSAGSAFLMAFPDADGNASLSILGPLTNPPATNPVSCDSRGGGEVTCDEFSPLRGRCQTSSCGSDVGVCTSGTPDCSLGTVLCAGVREPDPIETCDNDLDDDCDGQTDEAGCGTCTPTAETCNAADDDCDGLVDEDVTDLLEGVAAGGACGSSVGACEQGVVTCTGGLLICSGGVIPRINDVGTPTDLCGNGEDDDCNGTVDDASCTECVSAGRERCNGRDDDCDGVIDETRVVGPACNLQDGCDDGALTCRDGQCIEAVVIPSVELMPPPMARDAESARQCISTDPMPAPTNIVVDGFSNPFDDLVADGGASSDFATLRVGLAWRERAAMGDVIAARVLELDATCACRGSTSACSADCDALTTPTGLRSSGEVVRLSAGAGNYGPPTIVYASSGFYSTGETGGWYVLWPTDSGIVGRRLASDGTLLESEPWSAGRGSVESLARAFRAGSTAGLTFVDTTAREIVSARLQCAPR